MHLSGRSYSSEVAVRYHQLAFALFLYTCVSYLDLLDKNAVFHVSELCLNLLNHYVTSFFFNEYVHICTNNKVVLGSLDELAA